MLAFVADPEVRIKQRRRKEGRISVRLSEGSARSSTRLNRRREGKNETQLTRIAFLPQLPLLVKEEMQYTHSDSHTCILPILTSDHDLRSRSKMRFEELDDLSEERCDSILVGALNEYEMERRC